MKRMMWKNGILLGNWPKISSDQRAAKFYFEYNIIL